MASATRSGAVLALLGILTTSCQQANPRTSVAVDTLANGAVRIINNGAGVWGPGSVQAEVSTVPPPRVIGDLLIGVSRDALETQRLAVFRIDGRDPTSARR